MLSFNESASSCLENISHKQRQDEKCSAFILEKSKKFKTGVCKRAENSDDMSYSQSLPSKSTMKLCHFMFVINSVIISERQ